MTKGRHNKRDPIESRLEVAFEPGRFVADRACFEFVSGLESAVSSIDDLVSSDPVRAVALYETALAGCHLKAEELDDSSGSFGMFTKGLICRWIRARQESAADPTSTATILLAWMDDDPYAFCYQIEKDVCRAFAKPELAAFEALIRVRYEAAPTPLDYDGRRWSQTLRTIYLAQKNVTAYKKLAEETGFTAQDCLSLAGIFAAREPGQALEAAWKEFLKHPSKYSFEDLLQFAPKEQHGMWREQALDAAKQADLDAALELYVEAGAWERVADLVNASTDIALENLSHYIAEPAAKKLEKTHPAPAAPALAGAILIELSTPARAGTTVRPSQISNEPENVTSGLGLRRSGTRLWLKYGASTTGRSA